MPNSIDQGQTAPPQKRYNLGLNVLKTFAFSNPRVNVKHYSAWSTCDLCTDIIQLFFIFRKKLVHSVTTKVGT